MRILDIIAIVAIVLLLINIAWMLFPIARKGFKEIFKKGGEKD